MAAEAWSDEEEAGSSSATGAGELVKRRIEEEARRKLAGPYVQSIGQDTIASLLSEMKALSIRGPIDDDESEMIGAHDAVKARFRNFQPCGGESC